jgi:hypothetical protein
VSRSLSLLSPISIRSIRLRAAAALALGLVVLTFTSHVRAQVHWDGAVEAGANKRFATSRPRGGDDFGVGPVIGLQGHVALLPMLRLGAYARAEISPSGEPEARRIYAGGLRVKFSPPWPAPRSALHLWVFAGVGYAGVYAPSYDTTLHLVPSGGTAPEPTRVFVPGAGGGFVEVPFGVGGAWRFRKPWQLTAELAARAGFGFSGSVYDADGRPAIAPNAAALPAIGPAGNDGFALGLTVGVGFDL